MSPAPPRKAARKAAKAAKPARKAAPAGKARRPKAAPAAPERKAPAPTRGGNVHAHCDATDPFGDPCQNLPRRPSRYCVIHSYLER